LRLAISSGEKSRVPLGIEGFVAINIDYYFIRAQNYKNIGTFAK
jgi:hypothetical protein